MSEASLRRFLRAAMNCCWLGALGYAGGILLHHDFLVVVGILLFIVGLAGFYCHSGLETRNQRWRKEEHDRRFEALIPRSPQTINFATPELAPLLALNEWDQLSSASRRHAAESLEKQLPAGWNLKEVRRYQLAKHYHEVSIFDFAGVEFALIPGGLITLGYDPQDPFVPTPEQLRSWGQCDACCDQSEVDQLELLHFHLAEFMMPLRTIRFDPFLVACGAEDIKSIDDLEELYEMGFRPPTSDEWEYCCGAGARSFFRWGSECPTEVHPESMCDLEQWHLHLLPNAFGLTIADSPSNPERCLELDVLRGGDGGGSSCGGDGAFWGWLSLATSYAQSAPRGTPIWTSRYRIRRVYPLLPAR